MPSVPDSHAHRANPAHHAVRQATEEHHRAAEQAFESFDLRDFDGYGRFLQAQAAAVLRLEALAERAGIADILADWPERSRRRAVIDDLHRLGLAVPAVGPAALFEGEPLGIAYVLEGSRHGARVLLKRVLAGADPRCTAATAFLGQPLHRDRWSALLETMRRRCTGPAREARLTAAALFAFDCFRASALAHRDLLSASGRVRAVGDALVR